MPLPSLLSQILVAFIVEFDNEFELRMPHRTSNHGGTPGAPWLVSMAMWSGFMQFVTEEGVPARWFGVPMVSKMASWGYVKMGADRLVRPTRAGRQAQQVWGPLMGMVEERFGEIAGLRELADRMEGETPACLPILGYGLFCNGPVIATREPNLPALLSKILLAFAREFEQESRVSLAVYANVLRLLGPEGVRSRDLVGSAGVSKEAIATALSYLEKQGYATVGAGRVVTLTEKGLMARDACSQRMRAIQEGWQSRFGAEVEKLRESLAGLEIRPPEPYPTGWRAAVPRVEALPHFPMILHRGGFPDGS